MRTLIFGAGGMLGKAILRAARERDIPTLAVEHSHGPIESLSHAAEVIATAQADVVINAAGVIPLRHRQMSEMIRANALGPHVLADACRVHGARLFHVSTDCVFSGSLPQNDRYTAGVHTPDAQDDYGRSKALGEVSAEHVVNLRTSFVGPEHGLWAWLQLHPPGAEVPGWRHALWTGSTADAVARGIVGMLSEDVPGGTYHLATGTATTKAAMLHVMNNRLGLRLDVRSVDEPVVNRALRHSWHVAPALEPFDEALERWVREHQEA